MSYLGAFVVTVWRLGAASQGPYGTVPGSWAADHTISGCMFQSLKGRFSSHETQTAASDEVLSIYLLHLPAGSDVVATDEVGVSGIPGRFLVSGDIGISTNTNGTVDHYEVYLVRTSG